MYQLGGGVVMGWAMGANDGGNVFGTAVASRMVGYRVAVTLSALFILCGAVLQGTKGIETIGELTVQSSQSAMVTSLVAGATVILMTAAKLPVSTSQAVMGALIGMGLRTAPQHVQWEGLVKVVICWVGTPIGAAILAAVLYPCLGALLDRMRLNIVTRSILLRGGLLVSGCYGAYALGANNVANVTGVYSRTGLMTELGDHAEEMLALIGGLSIALGVITYSKNVMLTVGSRLVQLGAFSALISVVAMALTVHFYAMVGVPVSTSQAIVGAVLGIGIAKSVRTINGTVLLHICLGWVLTPAIAGVTCYLVGWLTV